MSIVKEKNGVRSVPEKEEERGEGLGGKRWGKGGGKRETTEKSDRADINIPTKSQQVNCVCIISGHFY